MHFSISFHYGILKLKIIGFGRIFALASEVLCQLSAFHKL